MNWSPASGSEGGMGSGMRSLEHHRGGRPQVPPYSLGDVILPDT